ncbi:MAG: hypothetical protein ACPGYS_06455, partial [Flavobacteriales bacterium]
MRTFFTALAALCMTGLQAQFLSPGVFAPAPEGYCVSIETVTSHEGGDLDGMTTYRVFLNCLNETDYLSSVSGDTDNPMTLASSTGSWYNNALNTSWNASGLNPAFVAVFPDMAFDSFLTIGAEDALAPAAQQPGLALGDIDPFVEFTGPLAGSNVTVDDQTGSAWFVPFPGADAAGSHVAFAGPDLKILVAQITTDGTFSGQAQFQVFMNADQSDEWRDVLEFDACGTPGCIDAMACNYDDEATDDDGSCEYIADGECDCEGNVLDECGVCGGEGIADGACDCEGNVLDECGVCGGEGIADGACDCEGNVLDECGVCGGEGIADGACDCEGNVLDE